MTDRPLHEKRQAEPPVRGSGPVEGVRGNREVPPADSAARSEGAPGADLEQQLGALAAERDEYLNDLRRVAADFDNFRKRTAREQADLITRANERLVKELLPVLDDLGRALDAASKHDEASVEDGVRLVERQLRDTLAKEGLVEIDANGHFDPHVHEALLSQPSDQEEGTVVEVIQKGYRLGDRVLRPARVVVAGPKAGE